MLPVSRIVSALKQADADWVAIKIADGIVPYNVENGDKELKNVIDELKANGIQVGGWQFIYTSNRVKPGIQAAVAGERVQKLGLEFFMIDAEEVNTVGALWKTGKDRKRDAKIYTNQLRGAGIPLTMSVSLMSYRFPYLHKELPFSVFLKSGSVNTAAPQMYWMGSHNPAEQLEQCLAQYDDWDNMITDYVPIGATFAKYPWESTVDDIKEFLTAVNYMKDEIGFNIPAVGFWLLDQAIDKPEWLDAVASVYSPPPVVGEPKVQVLAKSGLNIRTGPGLDYPRLGAFWCGAVINVMSGVDDPDGDVKRWYEIGKDLYIANDYKGAKLVKEV